MYDLRFFPGGSGSLESQQLGIGGGHRRGQYRREQYAGDQRREDGAGHLDEHGGGVGDLDAPLGPQPKRMSTN